MSTKISCILCGLAVLASTGFAQEKSYKDPDQLAALIAGADRPYILVDVRTPEEYASGHIPTAVNIPVTEIGNKPPTDDKAALIIVYCRSGARSAAAAGTLTDLGYTRVVDFGSVSRWKGTLVEGDMPVDPAQ
jgi:rhodanese-related sulfurtransferase